MTFGKLQAGCHVPFTEEWLPSGHSTIKAWMVECCRDGCPSVRFSHLHRGTLELCQSDHWVLGHLPDQGPSPPIDWLGRVASSRKSLGGSKLLPFKNDVGTVFLGTFNAAEMFWYPSPALCLDTILSWSSSTSQPHDLMTSFPSTSWLGFCSGMSTVGPYIGWCVPFQIMWSQLNLPQVDSNQVVGTS